MSPAWTIVTEQAFNVANDRHCCRSPVFHPTLASARRQFYGVSLLSPFSLSHSLSFFPSSTHTLPSNTQTLVSSLPPRRTVPYRTVALSFQRGLWFYGGGIGHNEPVVSAYKRRTRPRCGMGRDLRAMRGPTCAHGRGVAWLWYRDQASSPRRCAFSIVR